MRKLALSLGVIFTLSFVPIVSASGNDETSSAPIIYDQGIKKQLEDKQLRYRLDNNLDESEQTIEKALLDTEAQDTIEKYGVALTNEEESYIKQRDQTMEELAPKIRDLIRNGEEFSEIGTFHQETKNGLKFVVGFSVSNTETEKMKESLKDLVPSQYLQIKNVKNSEKSLMDTYTLISSDKKSLENQSIIITSLNVDIINNTINIGIEPYSEDYRKKLEELYGKHIINVSKKNKNVKREARYTKVDILVGGLAIAGTRSESLTNQLHDCSTAFTAKKGTDRFILTAGHCTSGIASWFQGGDSIGSSHYTYEGDYADVGLIKVPGTKFISNYIYKYSAYDSNYTNYETRHSSANVGDKVCLSGATTGFQCGQIESVYAEGVTGNFFIETSGIDSDGGDSGGAYWYNGTLKGIHSGGEISGTPFTVYTHVSNAITYGGAFTPYTSSTAN